MALSQLLKSEIAKTESDPNSLLFNGMPETEDTFLAGRLANDYAKYEELEDDSQISSLLQARKLAPVSREYVINPGGDSKDDIKIADLVRDIFSSHISLDMLTIDMLDALMKGNQVGEIMWDVDSKTYFPDRILTRAQGRFGFARPKSDEKLKAALAWGAKTLLAPPPDNELKRLGVGTVDGYEIRLLDRYPLHGENVPDKKFIVHHVGSKNSNPKGKGFGSKLWWLVQFKREAAKFWLIFLDKFASPTPYGTYPPNGSKHELEEFLERITQGMWAAFPQGYTVAMLEASRSGSIEAYEGFINRYCNREMAKVILGQFYLGESQGLSGAPANNDETVRTEIAKADADMVSNTLNQTLMRWLTEFNAPAGTKPPTIWRVFPEHVDLNARVSRDKSLFDMGHRLTSAAVKEIYGEGYVDTSLTKLEEGKDIKLPLITTLGDTGMNALIGFVKEAAGGAVPKENAIAIMQAVFGVDPDDAAKMLPDPQPTEEDEIGSILGEDGEAPAPEEVPAEEAPAEALSGEPVEEPVPEESLTKSVTPEPAPSEITPEEISAALDEQLVLNTLVLFNEDGSIEFAGATGKKKNCNPQKSISCGGSCQPILTKSGKKTICKVDLSPNAQASVKAIKQALGSDPSTPATKPADTPLDAKTDGPPPSKQALVNEADTFLNQYTKALAQNEVGGSVGGPRDRVDYANQIIKGDQWQSMSPQDQASFFDLMTNATAGNVNSVGSVGGSGASQIPRLAILQQDYLYSTLSDDQKNQLASAIAANHNRQIPDYLSGSGVPRIKRIGDDLQQRLDAQRLAQQSQQKPSPKDDDDLFGDDLDLDSLLGDDDTPPPKPKSRPTAGDSNAKYFDQKKSLSASFDAERVDSTSADTITTLQEWSKYAADARDADPGGDKVASLTHSANLSQGFAQDLKFNYNDNLAIRDKTGNLQAMIQVANRADFLMVETLVANPRALTGEAGAAKGAGSHGLIAAIKESQARGFDGRLKLLPVVQAVDFYKKVGFDFSKTGGLMELSPEKAKAFLEKMGASDD